MIWFDRLTRVIPNNIITEIRNLVSHQGLQRRKLTTAASNINILCSQAHELQTNAESLTRRIDHVLTDMVNIISEGDEIISSMSRTLDPPIMRIPSSMDGSLAIPPESGPPHIDDQRISIPIDCPEYVRQDSTPSDWPSDGIFDSPEELPPPLNIPTYLHMFKLLWIESSLHRDHLRPMINMINGINPSYIIYPIHIIPGWEA
jgi:hypothetical protein